MHTQSSTILPWSYFAWHRLGGDHAADLYGIPFFFFVLRRMGENIASAHHTSTYFYTRRVSISLSCFRSPTLAGAPFGSHCRYSVSCPYQWSSSQPHQRKLPLYTDACVCRPGLYPEGQFRWRWPPGMSSFRVVGDLSKLTH